MSEFHDIRIERPLDNVGRIVLARPESHNTARPEGLSELCVAMDRLSADNQVQAIILAADGDHFSAGADFDYLDRLTRMTPAEIKILVYTHFQGAARRIWHCPKPTLALLQGTAVSVGCELALACDFRVASQDASFLEVWIKAGIMPPLGGTFLLPRIIGLSRAKNMCLRGVPMLADEALRAGLVSDVVSRDELQEHGLKLAEELAGLSAAAYAAIKESMHRGLSTSMDAEWISNLPQQAVLLSSSDFRDGLDSIKQQRAQRGQ